MDRIKTGKFIAALRKEKELTQEQLGEKLGVPPIVVLVSVYLGMLLYGVSGVILGPLAFSTVYEIGKEWDIWD